MFNTKSVAENFNELFFELKHGSPYALRFNAFGDHKGFEVVDRNDKTVECFRDMLALEHVGQAFHDLYFFLKVKTPYTLRFNVFGDKKGFEIVDKNISSSDLDHLSKMLNEIGVDVTFSQEDGGATFIERFKGEKNLRRYMSTRHKENTGLSYRVA